MLKKILKYSLGLLSIPLIAFGSLDQQVNEKTFAQHLDTIKNIFEVTYAPKEWKKRQFGWDLADKIREARREITPNMTLEDYQRVLKKFFISPNDYHVTIRFHSTALSLLPFRIQKINSKYLVLESVQLDQEEAELIGIKEQLQVGDEILEVDGRPIDDVIQEIKNNHVGNSGSQTDQRLAELDFSLRLGSHGHPSEKGWIFFKVKDTSHTIKEIRYPWISLPEEIRSPMALNRGRKLESCDKHLKKYSALNKMLAVPLYKDSVLAQQKLLHHRASTYLKKAQNSEEEDTDLLFPIGAKRSFVPPLGEILWRASHDSPFHAYLCQLPSGLKIAYLRIPSFIAEEEEINELASMIEFFERESEGLVIDLLNNPGGLLLYKYALAALLTDRPLYTPKSIMTITQEEVLGAFQLNQFIEMIEEELKDDPLYQTSIVGYQLGKEEFLKMKAYNNFIISEWNQGKSLTDPIPYLGQDYIKPAPVHYSKPLLVLVNELDFSCGDFFPALMQDNQRATLFGTKTAGAGGHVVETHFPNLLGISSFITTGSLGYRLNGKPIENLGVTPDIIREITENDVKGNYNEFAQALIEAIEHLFKK